MGNILSGVEGLDDQQRDPKLGGGSASTTTSPTAADAQSSSSYTRYLANRIRSRLGVTPRYTPKVGEDTLTASKSDEVSDEDLVVSTRKLSIAFSLDSGDGASEKGDQKVLVLGAGNFGTCLADHLAALGLDVTIWARDSKVVDAINNQHINTKYMPDAELCPSLKAMTTLDEASVTSMDVLIFSIPTQHMRSILTQVKSFVTKKHLTIFVNKGIENNTCLLPCHIVREEWGDELGGRATFLSGPSFAAEVVKRQPTCVAVASLSDLRAKRAQKLFHAPHFRVYTSHDVVGVEIAGAMKNVIALASGACAGLGYQNNARAAIITRGLAEMVRIGLHLGADPLTFTGLAGVGDLLLTATSEKSRNFRVGLALGRGEGTLEQVLANLGSVAEGVETSRALYAMCRKIGVQDSPLCDTVYKVLFEDVPVKVAVRTLMERDPSSELRGIKE